MPVLGTAKNAQNGTPDIVPVTVIRSLGIMQQPRQGIFLFETMFRRKAVQHFGRIKCPLVNSVERGTELPYS